MKRHMKLFLLSCVLGAGTLLSGCSTVRPWQKGELAKPMMAFEPLPLSAQYSQHIYASKEGASGGYGIGGGGCGCK
jgi:hypothetical protein